jgi:hypothetical protein
MDVRYPGGPFKERHYHFVNKSHLILDDGRNIMWLLARLHNIGGVIWLFGVFGVVREIKIWGRKLSCDAVLVAVLAHDF